MIHLAMKFEYYRQNIGYRCATDDAKCPEAYCRTGEFHAVKTYNVEAVTCERCLAAIKVNNHA